MDNTSDDDIDVLKTPNGENSQRPNSGQDNFDSNLNPILLLRQNSFSEDSIPVSTVHALQISFNSLQQKLNAKTKENRALLSDNKRMKSALRLKEYEERIDLRHKVRDNMDLPSGLEASAHAAGGTSEDDFLAEQRADKGMIHHLQKEVLLRDSALTKMREEVYRLQYKVGEMVTLLREKDKLQTDRDLVVDSYGQSQRGLQETITRLQEQLQIEKSDHERTKKELELGNLNVINERLDQELTHVKQKSQEEINKLRLKIGQYESDRQKELSEFQKLRTEKETLEARCKQYEIEVEIGRVHQQSLKRIDDTDDVDGDISTLNVALSLVKQQKNEYAELKRKVANQATVIKDLTKRGMSLKYLVQITYMYCFCNFYLLHVFVFCFKNGMPPSNI